MSEELLSIKTDLAVIKRDIHQIEDGFKRVDATIVQLSDIIRKLAVQDKMFESTDQRLKSVESDNEKNIVVLHNFDLKLERQINEMQRQTEQNADRKHRELLESIGSIKKELLQKIDDQDKRINSLENWRFYILGISAVVMFALSKIEWPAFF